MLARNDLTLSPKKNGEYWLQEELIKSSIAIDSNKVFFDIGANIGEWTNSAIEISENYSQQCFVHLFEPSSSTFSYLSARYAKNSKVKLNHFAASDKSEEVILYLQESLSAVNSLYKNDNLSVEKVMSISIDEYIKNEKINHIDLIKSDAEGHDFKIIQGAKDSLSKGIIDIWQFEYNSKWIYSKNYLKDVFHLADDINYSVAKLSINGIEIFDKWHPELERYYEANYLLLNKSNDFLQKLGIKVKFNSQNVLTQRT